MEGAVQQLLAEFCWRPCRRPAGLRQGYRDHRGDRGASLVEYALILALIAVLGIGALHYLGRAVSHTLNNVGNQLALGDAYNAQLPAPSLSLGVPASLSAGSTIDASDITATLSGSSANSTGTITFTVFGPMTNAPSDCTSAGTGAGTAQVTGDDVYVPTNGFTPLTPTLGDYWWYASYSGDPDNNPANSGCNGGMAETVVNDLVTPILTFQPPLTGTAGTLIGAGSVGATLDGGKDPTGTITFTVFGPLASPPGICTSGGTEVGTGSLTVGNGHGYYNPTEGYMPPSPGYYWWYASYIPDASAAANNNPANSGCGSQMVNTSVT